MRCNELQRRWSHFSEVVDCLLSALNNRAQETGEQDQEENWGTGKEETQRNQCRKKNWFLGGLLWVLVFFLSLSPRSQSPIVRCFLVISVERTLAGRHPISFLPGGRMGIGLVSRLASFLYIKIHLNHRVPLFFSLSAVNAFFVFFF